MAIAFVIPVIVALIIAIMLISPKWGVLVMLCCYLLMPEMPIDIGVHLKKNHILIMIVFIYFAKQILHFRSFRYTPFMFCILYLLASALFIPFKETLFTIQLYHIIYDMAVFLFFPIVIWNILISKNCIKQYRIALVTCVVIAGLYGLVLMLTKGVNPWVMLFSLLEGRDLSFWTSYYADENRLFGRISSVFFHPMHYAAFLGFSLLYVIYIKETFSKKMFLFIMLVLIINLFACGVRSVLGAIFITVVCFILLRRNLGITIKLGVLITILLLIVMTIPGLDDYITSIYSKSDDSTVGGSSIEMRLAQLEGAFREIRNNPLFGNGYGWSREYIVKNENHPILLGFESIIFVVLCNNGIIGLIIYGLLGFWYYLYIIRHVDKKNRPFFISLIVYYYAYECITGEFAFQFFMLFYTFMLFEYYNKKKTYLYIDN